MSTTSGTIIVNVKRALRDLLKGRPGLDGVLIHYGDPADKGRREQVWMGEVYQGEQDPVALRQGRRKRDESFDVWVHVDVASRVEAEENEARAVAIIQEVESLLAEDPKLGNVPGLLFATVSELRISTAETGDGPSTSAVVVVTARGRLQ